MKEIILVLFIIVYSQELLLLNADTIIQITFLIILLAFPKVLKNFPNDLLSVIGNIKTNFNRFYLQRKVDTVISEERNVLFFDKTSTVNFEFKRFMELFKRKRPLNGNPLNGNVLRIIFTIKSKRPFIGRNNELNSTLIMEHVIKILKDKPKIEHYDIIRDFIQIEIAPYLSFRQGQKPAEFLPIFHNNIPNTILQSNINDVITIEAGLEAYYHKDGTKFFYNYRIYLYYFDMLEHHYRENKIIK